MLKLTDKNIRLFFSGFIFLVCYSILIGYCLGPQSSLDTYWHLQMGKDFLENGLSPWTDHYSFTFSGKKINDVPILFQIILATFVSIFGETSGFIIFKISYVTLLLFVIYRFFRQIKAPWFVILVILPILTYFINMRLIIRPDTLSNILIIICLSLYLRARENFTRKELIPICLLMLFWVNYHTPIIGYIIIFGLFLDRAIYKFTSGDATYTWTHWFLWGAFIFFIGFINPSHNHVLILIFSLSTEWYQYLSEYMPAHIVYSKNTMVHLLWIASFWVICWGVLKKHFGLAFIAAVLSYYSWTILRLVPATSLINFCILAYFLSKANYARFFMETRPAIRAMIAISSLSLLAFTLNQIEDKTFYRLKAIGNYSQHIQDMQQISEKRFPVQISDYLKNFQTGGNILNTFNMGGYLIYALSPDFKVFIDGRTNILYPINFYKHYLKVISDISVLENDIKKYDIQYAIFKNSEKAQRYFSGTDALTINFADENYALFSRKTDTTFPMASKLTLFPMCWNNHYSDEVIAENALSESLFQNKKYAIKYILKLLNDYLAHEDKEKFIQSLKTEKLSQDSTKRLAAYLAIEIENYNKAKNIFISINKKESGDLLMISYSSLMSEDLSTTKAALSLYINKKGGIHEDHISDFDKIVILKTLKAIQEKTENPANSSYDINMIRKKLGANSDHYNLSLASGLPRNNICSQIFN